MLSKIKLLTDVTHGYAQGKHLSAEREVSKTFRGIAKRSYGTKQGVRMGDNQKTS